MQKVKNVNFSSSISNAKLYLEDIEEIIDKLNQKSLEVKISDNKNIYDNINELIEQKGTNPTSLLIEGKGELFHSISVRIGKNYIDINAIGSESIYLCGMQLNDFIKNKKNWLLSLLHTQFLLASSMISAILLGLLIDRKTGLLPYDWLVWLPIVLYSLLIIGVTFKYFWTNLELVREHQYGFLKRNSDSIYLMIIGAVLGSLLTILTQYLNS